MSDPRRRLLEAILKGANRPGAAIARVPREGRLELSSGQRRLWFISRLAPGNPLYNSRMFWRLRGALDVEALEWALGEVVSRHEVLRTRYEEGEGGVWQVVEDARPVRLRVEECDGEDGLEEASREETERGFDLERGPVYRARLLRLGEREHLLLLTVHHVAWDWLSVAVLTRELGALYGARVRGEDAGLPALEVQYADYAAWQRKRLESGELARGLAYWRERLAGMPGALEVPLDRPRPAVASYRGGVVRFGLGGDLMSGLRRLSEERGATLYMTLLGAWQGLLSRYTGRADVVVGTPIADRTRRELEGLIGFFVNTLVLRTDLSGDPSLEEVIGRARETAVGAYAHADVEFGQLVEELNPERDLSRSPLVQVTFQLQSAGRGLELEGLEVSPYVPGSVTARFDLELNVVDSGEGWLVYAEELYERESVERLVGHWRRLLEAMVEEPGRRLSEVELLSEGELERYREWNRTEAAYERERCAHELFEEHARRRPDALALVGGPEELTYAELNRRANGVARRLRALGVGPEDVVGVCVERGVEMVVGLLGVLKAGGTYLPLDPEYPRDRLAYILEDAGCRLLLTQRPLAPTLPDSGATPVFLDDGVAPDAAPPGPAVGPEGSAYLIYTSGSTGQPKGVRVGHRALTNLLRSMAGRPGLGAEDGLLAVTTVSFDIAGLELFLPLTTGGHVVVASRETVMDAARLVHALEDRRVTAMQATPVTWRMLLEAGWRGRPGFKALCGGEGMGEDLARGLLELGVELWNVYGPTETTIWSSVERVEDWRGITIGRPIANTRMLVLDRWLRPLPVGVPGELYIGGEGLASGYHRKPGMTAERFLPDPTGSGGERLYRTGDLARFRATGKIEHLGRVDEQVKVRGFRVELGEVEARLLEHPEVREAVVAQRRERAGETRLVAYLVCGTMPGVGELRGHLRERLPEYMVPAQFVELPALPRTLNGKVDRLRLPAPVAARPKAGELVRPRTATEARVAAIWQTVLGLPEVGADDDFFELGGDSMLAVRVAARLLTDLDVAIGVRAIIQQPTVAGLARLVDASPPAPPAGEATSATGAAELTPSQQWVFNWVRRPDHSNLTTLWEVPPDVDPRALQDAVDAVVRHHDGLRARFECVDGRWRQVIPPPGERSVVVSRIDLSGLPPEVQRAELESACARLQPGMDFERGPAMRVVHFDLGEHVPGRLLIVIAHLVTDAYSLSIVNQDIGTAYRQLVAGEAIALPARTTSFREYVGRLEAQARSAALQEDLRYWVGLPWSEAGRLTVDLPSRPGANTFGSERRVEVTLSEDETASLLRTAPTALGVEVQDLLMAALVQTVVDELPSPWVNVMALAHRRDIDFGARVDLSRTVGSVAYGHPELLRGNRHLSPRAAVRAIADQRRRIPRGGYTFELLQLMGAEDVRERLRDVPRPEIQLNYIGQITPWREPPEGSLMLRPAQESIGPTFDPRTSREPLLTYTILIVGGRFTLTLGYSHDLHRCETAERLAGGYVSWLRQLVGQERPG